MTRIIALALAIFAGGIASASDDDGKLDMAKADQIKTQLMAEGYEVRKVEMEDGLYEAYAMKDGERYEIYLDSDLNIVKSKRDD
ncbi:PepSY domain-containing protein [Roseovarius confluentis]|uniref:PepSY domain-containing protein n=1 Tax=Roseovarius confluentis TaxID=1852027 RepID=UPI000CDDCB44|nr:PepSY domain-containing protein [Roseovarius confluentis]